VVQHYEGGTQLWAVTLSPNEIDRTRGLQATFRSPSGVLTAPAGLDVIRCADCRDFPVEATAAGLVQIATPGRYAFRATKGTLELDRRPLVAERQVELYAGWRHLVLRTNLDDPDDSVALEWKTPEAKDWARIPREFLNTHPARHGLLGRYYRRLLPLDSPQPSAEAADYTRLDGALFFDWGMEFDPPPPPGFAAKPSTMEWTGTVALAEGETHTLRLNATTPARVFIAGKEVLATPGGPPMPPVEATITGLRGDVPILVRSIRPVDDQMWGWWFRLEWREPGGSWNAFVDYEPPAAADATF
jgi:hypothetical protein